MSQFSWQGDSELGALPEIIMWTLGLRIHFPVGISFMEKKLLLEQALRTCKVLFIIMLLFILIIFNFFKNNIGYVYFSNGKTKSSVIALLPGCHISEARGTFAQNRIYCSKGNLFVERGDPPSDPLDRGRGEIARYDSAWNLAKQGHIEEIDVDIRMRLYGTIKRIQRDYMPSVLPLDGVCGLWIHGASGSGKTRAVLSAFPNLYPKPRSIWWDGYQGEEVVLCDDVDPFNVQLGGEFKHWADFCPFIAQIKGGSIKIRPKKFIVTSQFKIEEIWKDSETVLALNRRFIIIEKIINQNILLF